MGDSEGVVGPFVAGLSPAATGFRFCCCSVNMDVKVNAHMWSVEAVQGLKSNVGSGIEVHMAPYPWVNLWPAV